ncbi:MAG TPA: aldolase/citrate lyase family protein [Gammaproteobacteria bacterium]|nr:aldolase/citrate lyase family protein [Gammaproteobacteria bacterium]
MRNSLKQISFGSWITLAHPAIAEIMAKAGFEWLVIDLEHSVITIRETEELIRVIELCGVKPYVRLTANDHHQIKRVMDAGARGIIVPMVKSADDVKKAADAMFYPPKGTRGVGLARAQSYGAEFETYLEKHTDFDLIVQIEHIDAVERLEEILVFPELAGFIVGPYDLSGSMGIPGNFTNINFQSTLDKIKNISGKYPHVKRGIHLVEPNLTQLKKIIDDEYDFIAYSVDIRILDVGVKSAINQFKRLGK